MSKNEPGKWVTPNGYSCKGYTRDAPPRTCYSTESSSLPTYQNSHVTTGRRRADDYLSCNDSVSESYENGYLTKETLVSSESRRRGTSNEQSYSFVSKKSAPRKGCFDRHGQTIGFLICVGTILVGAGLGMYFGVQFAVGQKSIPVTPVAKPSDECEYTHDGSGDPECTTTPRTTTTTTEKITTPLPIPCAEYKETDNFLKYFEESGVCACRSDLKEDIEARKADKILDEIETYLKTLDSEDHYLGSTKKLHFGECEDEDDCVTTIKSKETEFSCWTKNKDTNEIFSAAVRENCAEFVQKPTHGWILENSECLFKNPDKDRSVKYPLKVSKCLDNRFRKHSANCDPKSEQTHFFFSNWDNTKCWGTDSWFGKAPPVLIDCNKITFEHLWTLNSSETYLTSLKHQASNIKLKFDIDTGNFRNPKKPDECKMYDPIENKLEKGFSPCNTSTIWNSQ